VTANDHSLVWRFQEFLTVAVIFKNIVGLSTIHQVKNIPRDSSPREFPRGECLDSPLPTTARCLLGFRWYRLPFIVLSTQSVHYVTTLGKLFTYYRLEHLKSVSSMVLRLTHTFWAHNRSLAKRIFYKYWQAKTEKQNTAYTWNTEKQTQKKLAIVTTNIKVQNSGFVALYDIRQGNEGDRLFL